MSLALSPSEISILRQAVADITFMMRATIERWQPGPPDPLGHGSTGQWVTLYEDVPCYWWTVSEVEKLGELNVLVSRQVLVMPTTYEVKAADRVAVVIGVDGTPVARNMQVTEVQPNMLYTQLKLEEFEGAA